MHEVAPVLIDDADKARQAMTPLRLDGWGDGLMVITDQPAPNAGPHGGGTALLTTFGLSDAAFAALEQRWTGWWRQRFVKAG